MATNLKKTPEAKEEPITEAFETTPPQGEAPLVAQNTPAETALPRTASTTPLIALMGFISIALGLGVKLFIGRNRV